VQPNHYTDPAQFALALERWHQERKHWDACEASRLNALKEHISGGGIYKGFIGFCSVVLIGVAWYTGATYGAGAGWTLLVGGGVVLGGVMEGAENFERWRRKKDLDWRFFPNPQPVYIGPAPQQEAPPQPPRWEPPPAAPEPSKVTTLRQAIEILALCAGAVPFKELVPTARAASRRRTALGV
jgi:hypothetical protein